MPVNIKPIKTDEDYQAALAEIDRLFAAVPNTPEGDCLEVFVALVEAYEREHFPMPPYDARELRGLMKEYIKTIDNRGEWEAEFFMTMHEYAEWQIEPFLDWLRNKGE
jgi:antitoxin component HigA of HigAB toxin-antitoxin module